MNYSDSEELVSSTSTVGSEYSLEEIIDEILHHAGKIAHTHWLFRGVHVDRLRYWTEKLEAITPL